jgi:AraC-like DNA-binding protein
VSPVRTQPQPAPAPCADPLGAWLEAFPLQCRLAAGWEPRLPLAPPPGARADLLMVGVRAPASLACDGAPPRALESGAVVFARPDSHVSLRALEADPRTPADDRWVVATLAFEGAAGEAWARRMPSLLLAPADATRRALVERLALERDGAAPGASLQTRLLARWLLVEAVRSWLAGADAHAGRALVDPIVAQAVRLLADAPAEAWSLERLARAVPCSRTVLVERFTRTLGVSPMRHLLDVRMRRATELLSEPSMGLKHIATAVGYSNEASFGAAYKRWAGYPPGTARADSERGRTGAAERRPRSVPGDPRDVRRARPTTSRPTPTPSTS